MSQNIKNDVDDEFTDDKAAVEGRQSAVGMDAAKKNLMIAGIVVVSLFVIFNIFSGDDTAEESSKEKEERIEDIVSTLHAPSVNEIPKVITISRPPELPPIEFDDPPPPPSFGSISIPPPPVILPSPPRPASIPVAPTLQPPSIDPAQEISISGIGVVGGSGGSGASGGAYGGGSSGGGSRGGGPNLNDPSSLLDPDSVQNFRDVLKKDKKFVSEDDALQRTGASQISVTLVGLLPYMILQGKMIDATLETAIDTDVPGMLRALVSRDVYAEAGYHVLIPAGSKLIGEYQQPTSFNVDRLEIAWTRLILPNGVDIPIASGVADQFGRAGMPGVLDAKLGASIKGAVLSSIIPLASSVVLSKVVDKDTQSTTTRGADGTVTRSGDVFVDAAKDVVSDVSGSLKKIVDRYTQDVAPTIRIAHGTRFKVQVNQDIVFPRAAVEDIE